MSYQDFSIKKGGRQGQVIRDVELANIIAVLPGTTEKDHYVLVTGHYDSVALERKPYTGEEQIVAEGVRRGVNESEERRYLKILPLERERGPLDFEATAAQTVAPGVTDDGSGTAAVMELAPFDAVEPAAPFAPAEPAVPPLAPGVVEGWLADVVDGWLAVVVEG